MEDSGHQSQNNISGTLRGSDFELGFKPTKKPNPSTTNILHSILGDDNGSQDSILGQENPSGVRPGYVVRGNNKQTSDGAAVGHSARGILRTQDVLITYSSGNPSGPIVEAEQRKCEWV